MTLTEFYKSDIWQNTRRQIIFDRMQDGMTIDEHTGKPILNSYDIVLHHIKELTPLNVNNYEISLNPKNIMIVSHRSHNEIHARFGFGNYKKVYYVWGAPCSTKTTFVLNAKGNTDIIVDIDSLWEALTGSRYEKPKGLEPNVFSLRDALLDQIKTRLGQWQTAYIIDGGFDKDNKIRLYGAEEVYIESTEQECLERLSKREMPEDARKKWEGYIKEWFKENGRVIGANSRT